MFPRKPHSDAGFNCVGAPKCRTSRRNAPACRRFPGVTRANRLASRRKTASKLLIHRASPANSRPPPPNAHAERAVARAVRRISAFGDSNTALLESNAALVEPNEHLDRREVRVSRGEWRRRRSSSAAARSTASGSRAVDVRGGGLHEVESRPDLPDIAHDLGGLRTRGLRIRRGVPRGRRCRSSTSNRITPPVVPAQTCLIRLRCEGQNDKIARRKRSYLVVL
jgi:hypothetical protein